MSLDDVFNTGKEFAKSLSSFAKSRAMVYTSIAGTLGVGGWGYNDIKHHLHNIESIPEYRQKVDTAIESMDSTNTQIKRSIIPLLVIKDTLPSMVKHAHEIEQNVNENVQILEVFFDEFYQFQHNTEERLEQLEQKNILQNGH